MSSWVVPVSRRAGRLCPAIRPRDVLWSVGRGVQGCALPPVPVCPAQSWSGRLSAPPITPHHTPRGAPRRSKARRGLLRSPESRHRSALAVRARLTGQVRPETAATRATAAWMREAEFLMTSSLQVQVCPLVRGDRGCITRLGKAKPLRSTGGVEWVSEPIGWGLALHEEREGALGIHVKQGAPTDYRTRRSAIVYEGLCWSCDMNSPIYERIVSARLVARAVPGAPTMPSLRCGVHGEVRSWWCNWRLSPVVGAGYSLLLAPGRQRGFASCAVRARCARCQRRSVKFTSDMGNLSLVRILGGRSRQLIKPACLCVKGPARGGHRVALRSAGLESEVGRFT